MTDPLPMPTQRELATAHERRARIIAQLHEQAIVTANDLPGRHKAIGGMIKMNGRHWTRRPTTKLADDPL